MLSQIRAEEVGIDSMCDVSGDEEAIRESSADEAGNVLSFSCEGLDDALNSARQEIPVRTLTRKTANFLVVEQTDTFDCALRGVCIRFKETLYGGP